LPGLWFGLPNVPSLLSPKLYIGLVPTSALNTNFFLLPTKNYHCSTEYLPAQPPCGTRSSSVVTLNRPTTSSSPKSPLPFRLTASLSWYWSREKEGRAVEVVPGRLYVGTLPYAQLPGPVHTARLSRVLLCI